MKILMIGDVVGKPGRQSLLHHIPLLQEKYVFNEILLRAIVINITSSKFGNEKANKLLEFEKSVGFDLVEKVSEKLKIYEKNRKKHKKFEDFYPTLLKELE